MERFLRLKLLWGMYVIASIESNVKAISIGKIDSGASLRMWHDWSSWGKCTKGHSTKQRRSVSYARVGPWSISMQTETLICGSISKNDVFARKILSKLLVSTQANKVNMITSDNIRPIINYSEETVTWFADSRIGKTDYYNRQKLGMNTKQLSANFRTQKTIQKTSKYLKQIRTQGRTIIKHECKANIYCPDGFPHSLACGRQFPDGTVRSSCYRLVTLPSIWSFAKTGCELKGANLVSIESRVEQKFIENLIKDYGKDGHYWTSGSDEKKEGSWTWTGTSESVRYKNWRLSQPDNEGNDKRPENHLCIGNLKEKFRWNDVSWDMNYYYICEVNGRIK